MLHFNQLRHAVASICLVMFATVPASSFAQRVESVNFEFPRSNIGTHLLGYGFDLATGQVKPSRCLGDAAVVQEKPGEQAAGGRDTTFRLVSDQVTLEQAMQASASASASYGAASGSVSASFSRSFNFASDSTWIVAKSLVPYQRTSVAAREKKNRAGEISATAFDLAPEHLKRLRGASVGKRLLDFRHRCGDGYVASVVEGGSLYGSIESRNSSTVERASFEVSMSGSYAGVGGSASLSSSNLQALKSKNFSIRVFEIGTDMKAMPSDVDGFINYFQLYATNAKTFSTRPILVTIASYQNLPSWPRDERYNLSSLPLAIETAYYFDRRLAALQQKYKESRTRSLNAATSDHNLFYESWEEFDAENDKIVRTLDALRGLVEQCTSNYDACLQAPVAPFVVGRIVNNVPGKSWIEALALPYLAHVDPIRMSSRSPGITAAPVSPTPKTLAHVIVGFDFDRLSADYARWLLSLPLQGNASPDFDEAEKFLVDTQYHVWKPGIAGKNLSPEQINTLDRALKDWILGRIFEPLRSASCSKESVLAIDVSVCRLQRADVDKSLKTSFYGKGITVPPPPAPAPPPPETPKPRKEYWADCPGRAGPMRDICK